MAFWKISSNETFFEVSGLSRLHLQRECTPSSYRKAAHGFFSWGILPLVMQDPISTYEADKIWEMSVITLPSMVYIWHSGIPRRFEPSDTYPVTRPGFATLHPTNELKWVRQSGDVFTNRIPVLEEHIITRPTLWQWLGWWWYSIIEPASWNCVASSTRWLRRSGKYSSIFPSFESTCTSMTPPRRV